jgi:phosphoglycolate phosphatase/pyrophosphatase PpaX
MRRMPPRYRHLVFDFDGTLADTLECVVACARHALAAHGFGDVGPERVTPWLGVPLERSFSLMHGSELPEALVREMIATYRARYAELSPELVRAFPGVGELLADARRAGLTVTIATSKKSSVAWANARQIGIDAHIQALVGSDMVANYKPHPESVLRALAAVGGDAVITAGPGPGAGGALAPRADALVVGDATFDIVMGRDAGCDTCAVLWGGHDEPTLRAENPTHVARTVDALRRIALE